MLLRLGLLALICFLEKSSCENTIILYIVCSISGSFLYIIFGYIITFQAYFQYHHRFRAAILRSNMSKITQLSHIKILTLKPTFPKHITMLLLKYRYSGILSTFLNKLCIHNHTSYNTNTNHLHYQVGKRLM